MADPTTTALTAPAGKKLEDGYQSLIAFALDVDVSLWIVTLQPPGVDGGEPIDITTMHNDDWETKAAHLLKMMTDGAITCGYDPDAYSDILNLINRNGSITVHFPDGTTLAVWGWLRSFIPNPLAKREFPTANCAFTVSNYDSANDVESRPVLTSVAGT